MRIIMSCYKKNLECCEEFYENEVIIYEIKVVNLREYSYKFLTFFSWTV